ncbi:MAG: hypothetical protein ACREM6_06580 [Vulcanimicrobiaceae bacterium]
MQNQTQPATTRIVYPPGVPCWVETLQADPRAAIAFYAGLFGWEAAGPGPMPDAGGAYYVARVAGQDVAGIATLPNGSNASPAPPCLRIPAGPFSACGKPGRAKVRSS